MVSLGRVVSRPYFIVMFLVPTFLDASYGLRVCVTLPVPKDQIVWSFDPSFDRWFDQLPAEVEVKQFIRRFGFREPRMDKWVLPVDHMRNVNHTKFPTIEMIEMNDMEYGGAIALRDLKQGDELCMNWEGIRETVP